MAQTGETPSGIWYADEGQGDAVVLVHGFAASTTENWVRAGWVSMLARANRRVVCVDLRGHGRSAKPHDPGACHFTAIADDVLEVVDRLNLKKPDLIGFSLGARVTLDLLRRHGDRFLLGVLCGVGDRLLSRDDGRDPEALPRAMEAADPATITDDMARRFRQFAEAQGQDLLALAAFARGLRGSVPAWSPDMLKAVRNEILVIAGRSDELAGSPEALAGHFPNAKGKAIPGCGHMDCLVQPMFKGTVMDFLAGVPL